MQTQFANRLIKQGYEYDPLNNRVRKRRKNQSRGEPNWNKWNAMQTALKTLAKKVERKVW